MKKIYENIDYLEIKLLGDNTKKLLAGIVPNSPVYNIGDYEIRYSKEFKGGNYLIYDIYYYDTDINNKLTKIGSINWIRANTSKKGVFLTFPGLPFKNYGGDMVYDFLDNIGYNYDTYKFQVYRLDFCIDFKGLTVKQMVGSLQTEKLYFSNFPIRFDPKTKMPTRFTLPFSDDSLRVYNKKLDISDRKTYDNIPEYKEYLKESDYITRVEVQLNRNKFKGKFVNDLDTLYEYGLNSLYKKLKKYFNQNYITKNIIFEKDKNYLEISEKKEFEFTKKMFNAYKNKLIANPYGNRYLKKQLEVIENQLYPNKNKIKEVFV